MYAAYITMHSVLNPLEEGMSMTNSIQFVHYLHSTISIEEPELFPQ